MESSSKQTAAGDARLRLMLSRLPTLIWTVDRDLRFTSNVGAGFASIDVKPGELVGRALGEVLDGYEQAASAHRRALDGESTHYACDFGGRSFQTWVEPLCNDDGDVIGALSAALDVTEHAATRAALKESEQRLLASFDQLPATMWTIDTDLRVTSAIGAGLRLQNLPPHATAGRTLFEHFDTDDRTLPPIAAHLRALDGHTERYEGVTHGSPTEVSVEPMRDEHGEVIGAIAVSVDVSERKRMEMQLAESEERFRQITTTIDQVVWMSDTSLRELLYVSPAFERVWQRPVADVLVDTNVVMESVIEDDKHILRDAIERHRRGIGSEVEYRIRRRDGSIRWIRDRSFPVCGDTGDVFRVVGMAEDITAAKEAEHSAQLMMRELDHRVKNNLAAVLSIAHQSAGSATSIDDFLATLEGRVQSMMVAHDQLRSTRWQGAPLDRIVTGILEPYRRELTRCDGPPITVPAGVAQPLAMALHELATNAVKHGALQTEGGSLDVEWSREDDGRLCIAWTERGGAGTVALEPGTGFALIEGLIERELRGIVRFEPRPDGIVCTLRLPLDQT